MRDIKFRCWYKNNWEFETPQELEYFTFDELCDSGSRDNDNFEFMQFTGLLDKKGKEIYESDLLAFEAWEWYRPEIVDKDYIFQVKQSETGEWVGAGICTEWATYCEVVGNIYENPELLEAT